jgi:hypothetical protein
MVSHIVRAILTGPGCGLIALLLVYDVRRVIRPRIAGEGAWRQARLFGIATAVLGAWLLLQESDSPWVATLAELGLAAAMGIVAWSSILLAVFVARMVRGRGVEP